MMSANKLRCFLASSSVKTFVSFFWFASIGLPTLCTWCVISLLTDLDALKNKQMVFQIEHNVLVHITCELSHLVVVVYM